MDGEATLVESGELPVQEQQRRRAEQILVREGLDLWRARQQQLLAKKACEQKQLREMLLNYSPWGRPGGGAPNPDTVRKRKALQVETLYGEPSIASPLPAPLAHTLPRVHAQGQGQGQGQARRLRCDPLLLFQFQEADRRAVDNLLRYRTDQRQKEQYRLELDRLVQEKRRRQQEQQQRQQQHHHQQQLLQRQQVCEEEPLPLPLPQCQAPLRERNGGGVELVPLLDRRRYPPQPQACDSPGPGPGPGTANSLRTRAPLSSTDVTKLREPVGAEKELVWRDLAQQIDRKKRHLEALRVDELERCRRHFETWQLLWGRPGHGAPRDIKVKENLDVILYHLDRNRAEPEPSPAPTAPAAVAAR